MNRTTMLARLANETFDVLIVGGGATGLGCAVDAVSRGYCTALVEANDFAGATSSRSTKLVHGGVRYLAQGDIHLVREALHERTRLRHNAPALVHDLAFLTPAYHWYEAPYYYTGLRIYDLLAGRDDDFGRSRYVGAAASRERLPWLRAANLRGAIEYHDGQFDDARLAIALARTAAAHGAAIANYVRCTALNAPQTTTPMRVATVRDEETATTFVVQARAIVNATGIFTDAFRRLDDPQAESILSLSRGTHIVLAPGTLPGRDALLVPKTADGRVIFAIPWYGHTLVGTTDVATTTPLQDPQPSQSEMDYLLATLGAYAQTPIDPNAITATFAGLRPLVERRATATTAKLSREHLVDVSPNGTVTIAGGKWTTYRKMAQDAIDVAAARCGLTPAPCITQTLRLLDDPSAECAALVAERPELAMPLHPGFTYTKADVVNALRNEMARTVDDVVARRTRLAFLDQRAATAAGPAVAELIAQEAASAQPPS